TDAVRFGTPTPLPKWMQRQPAIVLRSAGNQFRHYREAAAHAGEPAVLREATQFNRALAGARNFENGMRNFRIGNVRLVSGIEEQKRLVFARVRDPRRKLLAHGYGAGWIIRKTEINQIDVFLRRLGDKIIFRRAAQIKKPFVAA